MENDRVRQGDSDTGAGGFSFTFKVTECAIIMIEIRLLSQLI